MRRLENEIKKNGYVYVQLRRGKKFALYSQTINGVIHGHEVFEIITRQERTVFRKTFPACEEFPGNERFGKNAWSVGVDPAKGIDFYTIKEAAA